MRQETEALAHVGAFLRGLEPNSQLSVIPAGRVEELFGGGRSGGPAAADDAAEALAARRENLEEPAAGVHSCSAASRPPGSSAALLANPLQGTSTASTGGPALQRRAEAADHGGMQSERESRDAQPNALPAEHRVQRFAGDRVPDQAARSLCSACPDVHTTSLTETRAHYKTAWHVHNVQAQAHGRRPVSLDAFLAGGGSHSDSESSESSGSSDSDECTPYVGSPFVAFCVDGSAPRLVYKALVFSREEAASRADRLFTDGADLRHRLASRTAGVHAVFLVRSGRVAAGIFDGLTGHVVEERTLKRYTTRRKQGGSQAARDASRASVVRSAGAALRRAGEQHLSEDVFSLLRSWSAHLAGATLIFWNGTPTGRQVLFGDRLLSADDVRLRTVPFATHRPSRDELHRVHAALFSVHRLRA